MHPPAVSENRLDLVAEGFIIFSVSAGEQHEREGAAHAIVQRQQAYNFYINSSVAYNRSEFSFSLSQ